MGCDAPLDGIAVSRRPVRVGNSVIDLHRGWGHHADASLDITWVLADRIVDGRIAHVQNFAADQHAADLFFWNAWGDQLRPIPDRLIER